MSESHARKVDRPRTGGWPGLLVAPLAALAALSVGHALVTPSCAWDSRVWLHVAFAVATLVAAGATWRSWVAWRGAGGRDLAHDHGGDGGSQGERDRFVGLLGGAAGGFFTLVIVAQWAAVAALSPCMR